MPNLGEREQNTKDKCEQNISFPEARKQYNQFYDTRSYASAVKPGTCNKSTQTDNKSTQTGNSFTEYLKQQELSPSEKKHPKKHLRENKEEERRHQYHKDKQEKELKEKEQAEKAQQNPYSVLHKDDEEVCMEEESVVFTDSSSSDHLPKGTLPRLPVT